VTDTQTRSHLAFILANRSSGYTASLLIRELIALEAARLKAELADLTLRKQLADEAAAKQRSAAVIARCEGGTK
jgi:hypothetical protein